MERNWDVLRGGLRGLPARTWRRLMTSVISAAATPVKSGF